MFELASHQSSVLGQIESGKVLVGNVGSGKSILAMAYYTAKNPNRRIVVITTAKKRDSGEWYADAMKMSLRNELIVDSWNNIKNYVDVKDAFFIFDEQRIVGSGAWVKAFLTIASKNDWLLLSATPADTWMDLIPVFIANGFYRNKTEFTNEHVRYSRYAKYPKVDGYYDEWLLQKLRDSIYVTMPYVSKAMRHEHIVDVDFNLEEQRLLYVDRWNYLEDLPLKDAGEMMRLMRKSANAHPSRYDKIIELSRIHPKLIIFYTHTYELEILRCLHTDLDIPLSEWNGTYHEDIPEGERWIYLVQYQAGSEGWNCTTTDTVIFYSLPYSYRQFEQAKGRIDRQNTPYSDLNYYIFRSRAIIDQAIWKALHRKKNFQASAFARKTWPKMNTKTSLN